MHSVRKNIVIFLTSEFFMWHDLFSNTVWCSLIMNHVQTMSQNTSMSWRLFVYSLFSCMQHHARVQKTTLATQQAQYCMHGLLYCSMTVCPIVQKYRLYSTGHRCSTGHRYSTSVYLGFHISFSRELIYGIYCTVQYSLWYGCFSTLWKMFMAPVLYERLSDMYSNTNLY